MVDSEGEDNLVFDALYSGSSNRAMLFMCFAPDFKCILSFPLYHGHHLTPFGLVPQLIDAVAGHSRDYTRLVRARSHH